MNSFHIHVDANYLSSEFENFLINDIKFENTDFCGHPVGYAHFEPNRHLTFKTISASHFRETYSRVIKQAKKLNNLCGYIEGEYIALDYNFAEKCFNPSIQSPIQIKMEKLPADSFRETEIHVTMNRDKSDPRLIKSFLDMGFFGAYIPKRDSIAIVLTVQGSRRSIDRLKPIILNYIEEAGGAVECSIKEERIAKWWISNSEVEVPPVIGTIIEHKHEIESCD